MRSVHALVIALTAGVALGATSADCDKVTRNALLSELKGLWFSEVGPPPDHTAIEVEVKGGRIRLWTVWLTDDPNGAAWVKVQRTGPIGTLSLDGPGCRKLKGTEGVTPSSYRMTARS